MPDTIKETCAVCKESIEVPNKGLGRAIYHAWLTRHQHPKES